MSTTSQCDVGKIKRIILKNVRDAFIDQTTIDNQYKDLNYLGRPDFTRALDEYSNFVALLDENVDEVVYVPPDPTVGLDSIYVRDTMVSTDKGIILCNMGKDARRTEPSAIRLFLEEAQIPILGEIKSPGKLEGGDLIYLDNRTIAVGQGYRTNAEGIRQLTELTTGTVDEVITVPLPHWNGPADVLHLMSFISPIDIDKQLIYSRLMPVTFRELLLERNQSLIEVPDEEYESMACNVLALAPGKYLMLDGNPITRSRLEKSGVEVITYTGDEISRKGAGGPTCLTRPILRKVG